MTEDDRHLLSTTDAAMWAAAFVRRFPGRADDEGHLLAWFANAMETARLAGRKASEPTMVELGRRGLRDSEAWFPGLHDGDPFDLITHYALGLAGEVGELINLIKKANRDRAGGLAPFPPERLDMVRAETADVLIYLLALAAMLGVDPAAAIEMKRAELIERWGNPEQSGPAT